MNDSIINIEITPLIIGIIGTVLLAIVVVIVSLANKNKDIRDLANSYKSELNGIDKVA